jgi:uncharacterized protein
MVQADGEGNVLVTVHVQPGSRRPGAAGRHGDALKLRVAAPPVDGRANRAVSDLLASLLHVPASSVELVSGASSRRKRLRISGVTDPAALVARVTELADGA